MVRNTERGILNIEIGRQNATQFKRGPLGFPYAAILDIVIVLAHDTRKAGHRCLTSGIHQLDAALHTQEISLALLILGSRMAVTGELWPSPVAGEAG